MKKLTKDDILKGKNSRESLHVDAYEADVTVRPLTDGELSQVLAMIGSVPLTPEGKPDFTRIDVSKNFQALRMAVSLGMMEPQLTIEEVGEMKFGVPEFIGTKILELSGAVTESGAKKKERK
jgi:hypothetical protein